MTKKGKEFQWTVTVKRAFKAIKDAFRTGDMRTHFDLEQQSIMDTDTLDYAIAARLQQLKDDGKP
jgi:hypothetical protein